MALIDEIRRKNPSLRDASDEEIKSLIRPSPEFREFSDEEFDAYVSGAPGRGSDDEEPGFWSGLSAGIDQMQAMGGGLVMAAGDHLRSEGLYDAGKDIYQRNMEEAGENDLGFGFTDIRSPGDAWQWAKYTAGNQIPMLAASIAGGGVGGAVAGGGARMLAGAAAKEGAKRAGQALGAAGASTGMETGAIMGETEDLDVSLAHGTLAGALDAVTPVRLLRRTGAHEVADKAASEISEGVLRDLRRQAGQSAGKAMRRGGLTNLIGEASTEGLQGLISQHANYWAENNGDTLLANLDEVDVKAMVDEAAAGGLIGGALGAPAGLSERRQARTQVDRIEAARRQAAQQGGDSLDQAQAAQQAEQTSMGEAAPVEDAERASQVSYRVQSAMADLDDLQNLARGSSYQGQTRLRNISRLIDRAEQAVEEGKIEQADRLTRRAEQFAGDLRSALRREGSDERPAQAEGEVVDGDDGAIAGLIGQDGRRLPPGRDPNAMAGESPEQFEARQRAREEQEAAMQGGRLGRDDVIYGQGETRDDRLAPGRERTREAFEGQQGRTPLWYEGDYVPGEPQAPDTGTPGAPSTERVIEGGLINRALPGNEGLAQGGDTFYGTGPTRPPAPGMEGQAFDSRFQPTVPRPTVPRGDERDDAPQADQPTTSQAAQDPRSRGEREPAYTPEGNAVDTQYRVVELSDLQASNEPDGRPNPRYPEGLQPRERGDNASLQVQVQEIMGRFNPSMLGRNNSAAGGTPIIGPDMAVESGNGRTMALNRIYRTGDRRARDYRRMVREQAEALGIDPELVDEMRAPVLVRERVSDVDRNQFAREANADTSAQRSEAEIAREDADRLSLDMLRSWQTSQDGDPLAASNRAFTQAFVRNHLRANERPQYLTRDGRPTHRLASRMMQAIVAKAYQDPEIIDMMQAQGSGNINMLRGLKAGAADFALARELGDADTAALVDSLAEAVRLVQRARDNGQAVAELLNQGDAFSEPVAPMVADLAKFFAANIRSGATLEDAVATLARAARIRAEQQNGLVAADYSNEDIVREAINEEGQPREPARPGAGDAEPGQPAGAEGRPAGDPQGAQEGRQQGQQEGVADEPAGGLFDDEPLLTPYTEEELSQQEAERERARREEEEQRRQEEERAQADAEVDDFRLFGSNAPADVAAGYGQNDLLGAGQGDLMGAQPQQPEPAQEPQQPEPVDSEEAPRGREGEMRGEGEAWTTASGRTTTPFPRVDTSTERRYTNTRRRVDEWLVENAREEARARGDRFNQTQFEGMNPRNLSTSDRDSAEMYLFGDEQPTPAPSILRDLTEGVDPEADAWAEEEGALLVEDGEASGLESVDHLPQLQGVTLRKNGLPFASESAARQAIQRQNLTGRVVRVPGGYGVAGPDAPRGPSQSAVESRLVRLHQAQGDDQTVVIEARNPDVLEESPVYETLDAMADNADRRTGITYFTFSDPDTATAVMDMLHDRGAIVDDWRGAQSRDGYLHRRPPESVRRLDSVTGKTLGAGDMFGATYIESVGADYVAYRQKSDGILMDRETEDRDRLETLRVEPRVDFERRLGAWVRDSHLTAPVVKGDKSALDRMRDMRTRDDEAALDELETLRQEAKQEPGADPDGVDMLHRAIYHTIRSKIAQQAEAEPTPQEAPEAKGTPDRPRPTEDVVRPEGRRGWRTKKAANSFVDEHDLLGVYVPVQEDGKRWILERQPRHTFTLETSWEQRKVFGEEVTDRITVLKRPAAMPAELFQRVLAEKARGAHRIRKGFTEATIEPEDADRVIRHLEGYVDDQRDVDLQADAPLTAPSWVDEVRSRPREEVLWSVNFTEQPGTGRTTDTRTFNTLREAREFARGKRGYILRVSDGGNRINPEASGNTRFQEYVGDFEPSAQEGVQIERLTGREAPVNDAPTSTGNSLADELGGMSDADLEALIDDVAEEAAAPQTEKPKTRRKKTASPKGGKKKPRPVRSRAEKFEEGNTEQLDKTAGDIAKNLGVNLSSGGKNAVKGLAELFGGKGKLNSGLTFDEETYAKAKPYFVQMLKDFQAAGKDLRELIRAILDNFGTGVKPYIMRFAQDLRAGNIDMDNPEEGSDAPSTGGGAQSDPGESAPADGVGGGPVQDGSGAAESDDGSAGGRPGGQRGAGQGDSGVSGGGAGARGAGGNNSVHRPDGTFGSQGEPAGDLDAGRGGDVRDGGVPTDPRAGEAVADHAGELADAVSDRPAKGGEPKPANLADIRAQVPQLMEEQAKDVQFAERRFFKAGGRGVLFSNGTGTGKTFTGLGIAKRHQLMGKGNIIVVVPNDKIAADWIQSGAMVDLPITRLRDTRDNGGEGAVVTTYANFRQNASLAQREWDLVIADEAHNLLQKDDFEETAALSMMRALTGYPGAAGKLVDLRNPERTEEIRNLNAQLQSRDEQRPRGATRARMDERLKGLYVERQKDIEALEPEIEAKWERGDTRVTFLSATPFAYRKSIDYANGFLFDYSEGKSKKEVRSYNEGDNRDQFFVQHFGYRLRYNKLTEPESDVDVGLMERQFNEWLKQQGAMRSRMLEVDQDYDRRFQLVEDAIGTRIDEGLEWLSERRSQAYEAAKDKPADSPENKELVLWDVLENAINEKFTYLSRSYLLEAIKAKAAVPYIQQHLDKGRKVVVFHNFVKGGGFHPFQIGPDLEQALKNNQVDPKAARRAFKKERPDLVNLDLSDLKSPVERMREAFGDRLVEFRGEIPNGEKRRGVELFNQDDSGVDVILVQADSGGAGISLHDTTGKHQRMLLNLGLPVRPTMEIQIEGRIYRVGVKSDAIQRLMSTGLSMERSMVASKLAARSGTAENLAMGNQARALKDNILEAYQDADDFPAGMDGEGRGGKELDRTAGEMTDFDRARSFYFANQKRTSRSKSAEGEDYFATPEPVGLKMIEWADIRPGDDVLEPSAGHGAIARWIPELSHAHLVEPSYELASRLRMAAGEQKVYESRFEELAKGNKYDAIAMNPPFGRGGKTAFDHLDKAYRHHLRPGGRLVALVPTGPAADKRYEKWLEEAEGAAIAADVMLPQVAFERAATKVATRILVIDKLAEGQQPVQTRSLDLRGADSIKELFDQIEGITIQRERPEPAEPEATQEGKKEVGFKLAETRHAKKGIDLFVATLDGYVEYDTFRQVKAIAQDNGGYYSKFNRNGAIPGFQFESAEDRAEFVAQATEALSPRYRLNDSRATRRQGGPSADAVREALGAHAEPLGDVEVVDSANDLPAAVLEDMAAKGVDPGDVRAVYHGNRMYVVAGNNASVSEALQSAVHEAVGHKGIRGVLGEELTPVMRRLFRGLQHHPKGREALSEVLATYDHLDPDNRADQVEIAEEMVAHLLEKGHRPRAWQRAVAKIRELLRKVFPAIGWTYTDVLALGEKSRDYLAKEQAHAARREDPLRAAARRSPRIRRTIRELSDSAEQMSDWRDWYDRHEAVLDRLFGDEAELFQQILSATSQAASVKSNVSLALKAYRQLNAGEPFTGYLPAVARNLERIREQQQLEGAKISEYGRASLGQEDAIAVDRHIAMLFFNTKTPSQAQIRAAKARIRKIADRLGWKPREVQASLWAFNQVRLGSDPSQVESYDTILEERADEIAALRAAFAGGEGEGVSGRRAAGPRAEEGAGQGSVRYSLRRPSRLSDQFDDMDPDMAAAFDKIAPRTPRQRAAEWWRERTNGAMLKIRQGAIDRFAVLRQLDEAAYGRNVVDERTTFSSWVLARMSNAASGALHAMTHSGRVYYDDQEKVIDIREGDAKGLGEVLSRLGSAPEIERFMGWIAGNRSHRLAQEGRENLFSAEEIEALRRADQGTMADGRNRAEVYQEVFEEFQVYRDDVLEIAEKAGIISEDQRAMWRDEFYVPFYRINEDDRTHAGPLATSGLSRQQAYKRLKGGSGNLNDLLQNTMMNFHHLMDASLKNVAAQQAVENAEAVGLAERVAESARDTKSSTFVMRKGRKVYYNIEDPMVFKAITALAHPGFNSQAMKILRGFKRLFTNLTTATPQFQIANLIRDSIQAVATNEVSRNVFANAVRGGRTLRDARSHARMMAAGGAFQFGHLYGTNPDELRAQLTDSLRGAELIGSVKDARGVLERGWRYAQKGWGRYQDLNNFAENVNRAAIWNENIESGRGKLRSAFESRDLIDFSAHGEWPAIRTLIDVVPFLNARLQGLDKIYRAGIKPGVSTLAAAFGKGTAHDSDRKAAKRFWMVTGTLAMATMMLYLNNMDDEDYQELPEWQKDTYWFFKIGNQAFFLPKPFEVGAIATVTERMLEQAVNDRATGKLFAERMQRMLVDTFSFTIVPQALQPSLDVYSNVDAFTGRPIESMGMDRLSPELRTRTSTTMPARAISGVLNSTVGALGNSESNPFALSPVQVDHLIQGYLGQIGATVAGTADVGWRAANGQSNPSSKWYEYQPVRRFYRNLGDEPFYTRHGSVFYDGLREAQRAYADVKELRELGRTQDATRRAEENREMLSIRLPLSRAQRKLRSISQRMDMIRMSDASPDVKRQRLDRLRAMRNEIHRIMGDRVEQARQAG